MSNEIQQEENILLFKKIKITIVKIVWIIFVYF